MTSSDPNPASPVEEQYTKYPYPAPGDDIPAWLEKWSYKTYEPSANEALIWPEGRPRQNLDILVAGCGSMQAAVLAFNNPESRFTGIDFSATSIAHEEKLRARHDLKNLTLQRMDLSDAATLGRKFDLVISSGVLHHLSDPSSGLRALATVLEPKHGVMMLMLYGRMGRIGVYALQDAFRRLGVPQSSEGIKFVRDTIQRLPPRHPARWYYDVHPDMDLDAAVVDTFLHPQDTAYSVPEVLNFVESNGLVFKGWLDRGDYNQDWEGVDPDLPERDRWSVIENLSARVGTHRFMASLPDRDRRSEISLNDDRWLDYHPQRHPELRPSPFDPGKIIRRDVEFSVSPFEALLLEQAVGRKTVSQILKHKDLGKLERSQSLAAARAFYTRMWRQGHLFISAVPIKRHP